MGVSFFGSLEPEKIEVCGCQAVQASSKYSDSGDQEEKIVCRYLNLKGKY